LSIARSQSVPDRARDTTRKVIEFLGFLGLVVIGFGRRRR
jgi:MYXO-CTERM domain-containing protein